MSEIPKSPNTIVADYIFGSDHEDFDVSWLSRKLDRYNNDSSFTSNACSSPSRLNETPTSKFIRYTSPAECLPNPSPNCKKLLDMENNLADDINCIESTSLAGEVRNVNEIISTKGQHRKIIYWNCVKSTSVAAFDDNLKKLKELEEKSTDSLLKNQVAHWTKAYFIGTIKCNSSSILFFSNQFRVNIGLRQSHL